MPDIPIPDEFCDPPSRFALAFIETWMLWPDDAERRSRAMDTCMVAHARCTADRLHIRR